MIQPERCYTIYHLYQILCFVTGGKQCCVCDIYHGQPGHLYQVSEEHLAGLWVCLPHGIHGSVYAGSVSARVLLQSTCEWSPHLLLHTLQAIQETRLLCLSPPCAAACRQESPITCRIEAIWCVVTLYGAVGHSHWKVLHQKFVVSHSGNTNYYLLYRTYWS